MRKWLILGCLLFAGSPAQAQLTLTGIGSGGASGGATPGAMTSPLMTSTSTTAPSTSAINYARLSGNAVSNSWSATAATVEDIWPTGGSFGNFTAYFSVLPGNSTGSYDVGMIKNGAKQLLACNIGTAVNSCTNNTSFSVLPGDLVGWFVCPSGGTGGCTGGAVPAAQTGPLQFSATFTSTSAQEGFLLSHGANPSVSAIGFTNFGYFTPQTTDVAASNVMPTSGAIDQLYAFPSSSPTTGMTVTLFKNGSAAPAGCTVGAGDCLGCTMTSASLCSDTNVAHAVSFIQGDTVSLQFCPQGVAGCPAGSNPAARAYAMAARWKPSITNQALLLDTAGVIPSTNATRYFVVNGTGSAQAVETTEWNIAPIGMTLGNMTIALSAAPGGAITRTFTLRAGVAGAAGQTDRAPSCSLTTLATCTNTNTYGALVGQALGIASYVIGGTAAATTYFKSAMTVTVP